MRKFINIIAENASHYPALLDTPEAIADYIQEMSSEDVDWEVVYEYVREHADYAALKMVPVSQLHEGPPDNNIRDADKEDLYYSLETDMPPLVVLEGTIIDGNHRFRVALKKGMTEVPCYVLEIDDESE